MTGVVRVPIAIDPPAGDWLTDSELIRLARFRIAKRRNEWLAGRFAAKSAIEARHGVPFRSVEIAAVDEGVESGRPFYRIAGEPGPFALSIAHGAGVALALLAGAPGERVGIDIETVRERDAAFESVALSRAELELLQGSEGVERGRAVTAAWVLKESLLKAVGIGLRAPLPGISLGELAFDCSLRRGTHRIPARDLCSVSNQVAAMHPILGRLDDAELTLSMFEEPGAVGAALFISLRDAGTAAAA